MAFKLIKCFKVHLKALAQLESHEMQFLDKQESTLNLKADKLHTK